MLSRWVGKRDVPKDDVRELGVGIGTGDCGHRVAGGLREAKGGAAGAV